MNKEALPLLVAEYAALRADILKLIELQQQLTSGALLALGVFLTVGLPADKPSTVLLTFPVVATFLGLAWLHKDVRIRQIAAYIRDIEGRTIGRKPSGLGWNVFLQAESKKTFAKSILGLASASGIFLLSQIFVVILAYNRGLKTSIEMGLLWLDIFCIVTLFCVLVISAAWNRPSNC